MMFLNHPIFKLTEDWGLFVRTYVVVGLVKQCPQFLSHHKHKVLPVGVVYETVREDTETLVDPQSSHSMSGVVEVFVSSQQALENLMQTKTKFYKFM